MTPKFILLIALTLFQLTSGAQIKVGVSSKKKVNPDEAIVSRLDQQFAAAIQAFNVPGMSVAIVHHGEVILSKGYGVADSRTGAPVDDHTVFAIASNSKAFTSAALATLVDEKKINWNDKVRTYLPYFTLYDFYVSEQMTIRDLLCHRSGLATFSGDIIWYGSTRSREEVIRRARFLEQKHGFRESFGYQNIMFLAAGEIIPEVTGMTWDQYIKKRFFQPLGMSRTFTSINDLKGLNNVAAPHNEVKEKNVAIDYVNWDNIGPAGSINSCAADLSQWIKLQLGRGTFDGTEYWTNDRTIEMWENYTPVRVSDWQRNNMPTRHFNGYGLGWSLMEYQGNKVVSHSGGSDGMISQTALVPSLDLGFVVLTNNNNSLPSCLMFHILDAFSGSGEERDWIASFLEFRKEEKEEQTKAIEKEQNERVSSTLRSLPLAGYCGTYTSELYGEVKVSLPPSSEDLDIEFMPTPLFKGKLSHWHFDTFRLTWNTQQMLPPGKATFVLDASGKATELRIDVPNPDIDFTEMRLRRE
jgi:CubicO group peptidase (beta-lactamase class C family)